MTALTQAIPGRHQSVSPFLQGSVMVYPSFGLVSTSQTFPRSPNYKLHPGIISRSHSPSSRDLDTQCAIAISAFEPCPAFS